MKIFTILLSPVVVSLELTAQVNVISKTDGRYEKSQRQY